MSGTQRGFFMNPARNEPLLAKFLQKKVQGNSKRDIWSQACQSQLMIYLRHHRNVIFLVKNLIGDALMGGSFQQGGRLT